MISMDTIVRSLLLKRGYPMHWYLAFLKYGADCLRELTYNTLKTVETEIIVADAGGAIAYPTGYTAWIRLGVVNGQHIRPLLQGRGTFNRLQNTTGSDITGVKPSATITVDSVPADGYNIIVALPTEMGGTSLGSYTKQSSDTTTTILAASIAAALSGTGVTITSSGNVVTVRFDTLTADYNGLSLDITYTPSGGVGAIGYVSFPFGYTLPTDGQTITLSLPAEVGGDVLCTYVKQSSDTTREILVASIFNAITFPAGYSGSYNGGDIEIDAPASVGATINDLSIQVSTTFTQSPDLTAFFGGVDGSGVIPNTATDFTGGVTAESKVVVLYDDPTLTGYSLSTWLGFGGKFNEYGEYLGGDYGAGIGYETDVFEDMPERNQIQLSQELAGCSIIMDFVGYGSASTNLTRVSPMAQAAIEQYIIWQMKEHGRHYSKSEAKDEERMWLERWRELRARMNPVTKQDIIRIFRRGYYGALKN